MPACFDTQRLCLKLAPHPQPLSAKQRSIVRVQHWLLFPVLLLARLSWCLQSMMFPFNGKTSHTKAACEVLSIAGHYAWLLTAAFTCLPALKVRPQRAGAPRVACSLTFRQCCRRACTSSCASSFAASCWGTCSSRVTTAWKSTATAATLSVRSWPPRETSMAASSMTGTRTLALPAHAMYPVLTAARAAHRFTGGLNRQVEHHLFPSLPRHNLGKAQPLIRAFCSKHGLYYEARLACSSGVCCAHPSDRVRARRTAPCQARRRACSSGSWRWRAWHK